jgi:type VI protein secretion system component Hcp
MAAAIHLEIPEIKGDSEVNKYIGQIDCESWSFNVAQDVNMHDSSGGAAAGSHVGMVNVNKKMCLASANLFQFCCNGTPIPKATLHCTKSAGKSGRIEWYTITMEEVIIAGVSQAGSGEGSMGSESVSLAFAKHNIKYFSQAADGSAKAGPDVTYNIRKAVEE